MDRLTDRLGKRNGGTIMGRQVFIIIRKLIFIILISLVSFLMEDVNVWAGEIPSSKVLIEQEIEKLEKTKEQMSRKGVDYLKKIEVDDEIYFLKKCLASIDLVALAKERYENAIDKTSFAKYVGIYDSLSIASRVMVECLPDETREEFLDWYLEARLEMSNISRNLGLESEEESKDNAHRDSDIIQEAELELDALVKKALSESLQDINSIEPNGFLYGILVKCQKLHDNLNDALNESIDLVDLDEVIIKAQKTMQIIKNRQSLKYNLWAEKIVRSIDINKKYDADEASYLYKKLGLIDLNLIFEPSLARAITERMYFLYDQIKTEQQKARVRYESIFLLDERKGLNDF